MIGALLEKLFVSVGVDLSELGSGLSNASSEVAKISRDLKRDFEGVGKSWQDTGQRMIKTGAVMSATITAPLILFAKESAKAATESKQAIGQVESALKSMGPVAGYTAGQLESMAAALQKASTFDDDEILSKVTANLLTFGNVQGKVFADAQQAAVDLSARLGQDLQSSTIMLGKALNDPVKGLTALTRVGVAFSASQTEMIKKLAEGGDVAGAQAIMLKALKEQYGGAGQAARDAAPAQDTVDAWREFQETVGALVLKVLPPLTALLTMVLSAFNNLSPGMQEAVLAGIAIVAALGPVITVVGALVSAFGFLIPIIAGAIPIITGIGAGFGALLIAAAPVVAIIAAVAAAGYLIYQNWGEIAPLLDQLWTAISSALGPPLQALISSAVATFTELWNGPLGTMIRAVMPIILQFQMAMLSAFGSAVLVGIKAIIVVLTEVFNFIGQGVKLVTALLNGEWGKAWDAAYSIVNTLMGGIPDIVGKMVSAVKTWLVNNFDPVGWIKAKIDGTKALFAGLYDAVVGHSYIPDMVTEIGEQMGKLDLLMVDPAKKATTSTKEAFRTMASDVRALLNELFPDLAKLNELNGKQTLLDKARKGGQISEGTYRAANDNLSDQRRQARQDASGTPELLKAFEDVPEIVIPLADISTIFKELPPILTEAQQGLADFGQSLGDNVMSGLRDVLTGRKGIKDAVKDLFSNFLYSTITDAMKSLEKGIFGEGGFGGFLGSIFSSVIGSRAVGGPTVPGRAYTVGSGEKFVPGQSGRVLSRTDAMDALGGGGGGMGTIKVDVTGARGNAEIMDMVKAGVREGIRQYDKGVEKRVQSGVRRRG